MKHISHSDLKYDEISSGIKKSIVLFTEYLQIVHLVIEAGKALKPHDMPSKVVFNIIDGEGIFNYDGKETVVKKGETLEVSSGKPRFWKNSGDKTLRLLVVKSLKED